MAWDVTKLKLNRSKTLDGGFGTYGLSFGASGSKMYCAELLQCVREYDLGMNYDPFTETFVQKIDLAPDGVRVVMDVDFNPTGDVMYVLSISESKVHDYNLSTPWDISTAVYSGYQDIYQYSELPYGWEFKPDGTMLYVTSNFRNNIVGYNMTTPWDISTIQKIQEIDVSSICIAPYGIDFKPDGTKMYINCDPSRKIIEYGLTTAWNIESAKYIRSSGCTVELDNVKFSNDGTAVYVAGNYMYEYTLPTGRHRIVRSV